MRPLLPIQHWTLTQTLSSLLGNIVNGKGMGRGKGVGNVDDWKLLCLMKKISSANNGVVLTVPLKLAISWSCLLFLLSASGSYLWNSVQPTILAGTIESALEGLCHLCSLKTTFDSAYSPCLGGNCLLTTSENVRHSCAPPALLGEKRSLSCKATGYL